MAAKKAGPEEWALYPDLYMELSDRLREKPWFAEGWQTAYSYLNADNPGGVQFRLIKENWFDGAVHFETWVTNAHLERRSCPLVLHIETSKENDGLSRNDFTRVFLARHGAEIQSWPGYTIKPNYALEPFNVRLAFTMDTLVPVLEAELERLRRLVPAIDRTIEETRKPLA